MVSNKFSNCAKCNSQKCRNPELEFNYPAFCPHENYAEVRKKTIKDSWADPELKKINVACQEILTHSGEWCRVKEIIEYCKKLEYKKLGLAFCIGLKDEAKVLCDILQKNSFEVISVSCQAGVNRKEVNLSHYKGACNPLMQAEVLNIEQTELNIMMGLCLGHDIIFIKHSKADVTPLVVKDRVMAHNPIGALYMSSNYYHKKLFPEGR